jgi:hypothetical protein
MHIFAPPPPPDLDPDPYQDFELDPDPDPHEIRIQAPDSNPDLDPDLDPDTKLLFRFRNTVGNTRLSQQKQTLNNSNQFSGSVTFWYGSGSLNPYTGLRIRILLFLAEASKMPTRNHFLKVYFAYFYRR